MVKRIKPRVKVYPNLADLSRAAAESIIDLANDRVSRNGRFTLVLSGGSTPRELYHLLAREYREEMPWSQTHLFWGDERFVPQDHLENNFGMAYQILISRIPVPPENIHPMLTTLNSPAQAALQYEKILKDFFGWEHRTENFSTFDLVILGVGEDGHTASLFPLNLVLKENERWVAAVQAPFDYRIGNRITLTLPVLNSAKRVFFLASGEKKREIIKAVLQEEPAPSKYPAGLVNPLEEVIWFVDRKTFGEVN